MGNHYIPRLYLRGFEAEERIYAHSKEKRRSFRTKVGAIAHSTGFYSDEVEKFLTEEIEDPAKPAILSLQQGRPIGPAHRLAFARYVFVLWKRVPKAKARFMANIPNVADELQKEMDWIWDIWEIVRPDLMEKIKERRAQFREEVQRQTTKPHSSVWDNSIKENGTIAINSIHSMTWVFLTFRKTQLLTSDNPVFSFPGVPLNHSIAELTLPLTSTTALWASRRKGQDNCFVQGREYLAKELNRRTAHHSDRFIFSQRDEDWIMPFISRSSWELDYLHP